MIKNQTHTHRAVIHSGTIMICVLVCLGGLLIAWSAAEAADSREHRSTPEKELLPEAFRDSDRHAMTDTGSYVHHVTRRYSTTGPSLSIKVPGGMLTVGLSYEKGEWLIGPARSGVEGLPVEGSGLRFHDTGDAERGEAITTIIKDGRFAYHLPDNHIRLRNEYDDQGNLISQRYEYEGQRVYLHRPDMGMLKIFAEDEGYRWEDKFGNWTRYDSEGRLIASGTRLGTTEEILFNASGAVSGYVDRNGSQVIWIDYSGGRISGIRDREGRQISLSYDGEGRLQGATDVLGHSTSYSYNEDSLLSQISQPGGRIITISYNAGGNVTSVLDAEGRGHTFEFAYDKSKEEFYAFVTSSAGLIKEYWYDEKGDTKQVAVNGTTVKTISKEAGGRTLLITDERGLTTRKEYDEWTNLTKVEYPDGSSVSYQYEHKYNQRIKAVNGGGIITEYEYDNKGSLIKQVEAVGSDVEWITEYTYDSDGNMKTLTLWLDVNTEAIFEREFDELGNMLKETDPEGNTMEMTYDARGNILTRTDGRGKVWRHTYDDMDRLTLATDPLNHTISWEYDAFGNVTKFIEQGGEETVFVYDHYDNLIQIEDAIQNSTFFEYDHEGKLIRRIDPAGTQTRYEYDMYGRQVKIIDGDGNEIVMEYDDTSGFGTSCSSCPGSAGIHQPVRITYPTLTKEFRYDSRGRTIEEIEYVNGETYTTRFTYDMSGNLVSTIDKEGQTTTYDFDMLSRQIIINDPVGQTIHTYNVLGKLLALTDARGQTTEFRYDKNGRLIEEKRPLGQITTYAYDGAGNLTEKHNAKRQTTTYRYDDAGRLIQIHYANGKTMTFTYDQAGNLASYADHKTSAEYEYDALHRKIKETMHYGDFTKTFMYSYSANGFKQSTTMPDGTAYNYLYDNSNQLRSISFPGLGSMTVKSYHWTQPENILFPGGNSHEYTYDPLGRITAIIAKDPGQNSLLTYQYTHDKMNNILTKETKHGNYTYNYDVLYRLTHVNPDISEQEEEIFTYDSVGNRLTSSRVDGEWSYNKNNELLGFAGVEYAYDENGNMIQKRVGTVAVNYIYDADNRLVRVEDDLSGLVIAEYGYDPFGRRLWKDVGGKRTYFFYSDEGLVGEYDENGHEIRSYGYIPNSMWTTNPVFMNQDGEYYFYHNDHLGTPQKLVAVNGAVVWSATYQAYGKANVNISTVTNNLRFPGQYYDAETGLHYNWHRYYEPETGRYLGLDPIGFEGNDSNVYRYAANNPGNVIDPDGRFFIDPMIVPIVVAITLVSAPPCQYLMLLYSGTMYQGHNSRNSDWVHCYGSCIGVRYCGGRSLTLMSGYVIEWIQFMQNSAVQSPGSEPPAIAFDRDMRSNRYGIDCSKCGDCMNCCDTLPPFKR